MVFAGANYAEIATERKYVFGWVVPRGGWLCRTRKWSSLGVESSIISNSMLIDIYMFDTTVLSKKASCFTWDSPEHGGGNCVLCGLRTVEGCWLHSYVGWYRGGRCFVYTIYFTPPLGFPVVWDRWPSVSTLCYMFEPHQFASVLCLSSDVLYSFIWRCICHRDGRRSECRDLEKGEACKYWTTDFVDRLKPANTSAQKEVKTVEIAIRS